MIIVPGRIKLRNSILKTIDAEQAQSFAILFLSLGIYILLRTALIETSSRSGSVSLLSDLAAFVAAGLLGGIRHRDIPTLLRPLLRGIGAVVLAQMLFDDVSLIAAPSYMLDGEAGPFFRFGGLLATFAGFLAIWRPSFVLPLFFHYVAFRHQIGSVSGIPVSETDYLSMMDVGLFVAVGAFTAVLLTAAQVPGCLDFVRSPIRAADGDALRRTACSLIWALAVGAHLGNYFFSGYTKIRAGGAEPLTWLLHNPTQTSILIGLERGDNPLAIWPGLVQASWDAIVIAGVGMNLFVLGVQIAAPLAIMRRRLLMAFTLAYDLFHVAVYFTLGALFFFWIAVNTLIFVSARRIDDKGITPAMKIVAVLAVGLGHFVFYTSHLGWLDGAKLSSPSIVAETRDGRLAAVPSVYFGIFSYSIAQTAMYIPDDHFPFRIGGNSHNLAEWRDSRSCGPEIAHHQDMPVSLGTVEKMIRGTDLAMRARPILKDENLYYIYPHHMVPNPLLFDQFNAMSIKDIVRYHYVVESVCLDLHDGKLARDVHKRSDYAIDVAK